MPRRAPEITEWFDREATILSLAAGRSVLHLGCVGDPDLAAGELADAYRCGLHARLTAVATTVGVDRNAEALQRWRQDHGVDNTITGDVEDLSELPLGTTFDLIVAADLIEHLSNPGRLLDGIRALCERDTEVVITTPNAFGAANYLRYLRGTFADGEEHVAMFNPVNIVTLLERHRFRVERLATCHQASAVDSRVFRIGAPLLGRFPKLGGTLFVVARAA
jgi:2-polyprenyl-3-methyl-5-hydroxy-6-metoxy-1,4-benzoquinol methylase